MRLLRPALLLAVLPIPLALGARAPRSESVVAMGRAALDGGSETIPVDGAVLPGAGGPLTGMAGEVQNAGARPIRGLVVSLRGAGAEGAAPTAAAVELGARTLGFERAADGVRASFSGLALAGDAIERYRVREVMNPGGRDVELVLTPTFTAKAGGAEVEAHAVEPVRLPAHAVRTLEEAWHAAVIVDVEVGEAEAEIRSIGGSVRLLGGSRTALASLDVQRADGAPLPARVTLDGPRYALRLDAPLAPGDRLVLVARLDATPRGEGLEISVAPRSE